MNLLDIKSIILFGGVLGFILSCNQPKDFSSPKSKGRNKVRSKKLAFGKDRKRRPDRKAVSIAARTLPELSFEQEHSISEAYLDDLPHTSVLDAEVISPILTTDRIIDSLLNRWSHNLHTKRKNLRNCQNAVDGKLSAVEVLGSQLDRIPQLARNQESWMVGVSGLLFWRSCMFLALSREQFRSLLGVARTELVALYGEDVSQKYDSISSQYNSLSYLTLDFIKKRFTEGLSSAQLRELQNWNPYNYFSDISRSLYALDEEGELRLQRLFDLLPKNDTDSLKCLRYMLYHIQLFVSLDFIEHNEKFIVAKFKEKLAELSIDV